MGGGASRTSANTVTLYSRGGNQRFATLRADLHEVVRQECVLEGEIACLHDNGRLLRRRGEPVLVAFEILSHDGRDLRDRPLLERKGVRHETVKPTPRVLCPSRSTPPHRGEMESGARLALAGDDLVLHPRTRSHLFTFPPAPPQW